LKPEKDTPEAVYITAGSGAREIKRFRCIRRRKKVKKIAKLAVSPLEIEKRIMYNSAVVCSGMKR